MPEMPEVPMQPNGDPDRRRAPRAGLRLNASIREPGRSRVSVKVIAISPHGCRIESQSGGSPDTWVMLSIAGLDTQYSRIVWRAHEFAGLEFATPLAEAVLERLLADQSVLSETAIGDLRDIAQRVHRLSTNPASKDNERLDDLSRKCAADAVVEALRLGEARHAHRS
jgi:hypothetical protein